MSNFHFSKNLTCRNWTFIRISVSRLFEWPAFGGPKILVYIYLYICIYRERETEREIFMLSTTLPKYNHAYENTVERHWLSAGEASRSAFHTVHGPSVVARGHACHRGVLGLPDTQPILYMYSFISLYIYIYIFIYNSSMYSS